jgi:hypothetical protein
MDIDYKQDRPDVSKVDAVDPDILSQRLSELYNCEANTSLDFLKRLHNRAAVWQRYRDSEELHANYVTIGGSLCLRWRRNNFGPLKYLFNPDEFPVTVGVGEFAKEIKWLPSVVRLKRLEKCNMFTADTFEIAIPHTLTREAIWQTFKRKLDALGDASRILLGKNTSKVIQCIAQAACELAHDDHELRDKYIAGSFNKIKPFIAGEEIRIGQYDSFPQPVQVFVCPREESLDFLELVHRAASFASAEFLA